jgi:hypothetical protein
VGRPAEWRRVYSGALRYIVVGVAGDVRHMDFTDEDVPSYYVLDATVASINYLVGAIHPERCRGSGTLSGSTTRTS